MSDEDSLRRRKRRVLRGIFAVCNEAGIDRSDRIELANALLQIGDSGIESFSDLELDDLEDIYFVLRGWRVIQELRLANGVLEVEARTLLGLDDGAEETPEGDEGVRE